MSRRKTRLIVLVVTIVVALLFANWMETEQDPVVELSVQQPRKKVKSRAQKAAAPRVNDAENKGVLSEAEVAVLSPEEVEEETKPASPPPPTLGALSRSSIDEGIREVLDEVELCYREALEEVPDLEGLIRAKFTIRGEDGIGRVVKVSIKDADFDDVPLEDCLLDAIEEVEFPPPEGGGIVMVTYPFKFSPE